MPKFWLWLSFFGMIVVSGCGSSFSTQALPAPTGTVTIHPGDQDVPVPVVISSNMASGSLTITLGGLPSGISGTPLTLTAGGSGIVTLSATLSADQASFPPSAPNDPNTATHVVTVLAAAAGSSPQVNNTISLIVSLSNPSFAPTPSQINLPIASIDTGGQPIVSTSTDVPGTITITSANGQTSYLPNTGDTDNTATFHVHGHSTAEMPKLPYEFKLNTSLDLLDTMGLQCPYVTSGGKKNTCDKSKTYVLLANYDDKSLLRSWAASALANAIPMGGAYLSSPAGSPSPSGTSTLLPWAPHSLYVELYVNGQYEGNYQLIEKVNVDTHRVNITELSETDTTGDITGGYLLEIDHHQDEAFVFDTPQGLPVGLVDPDFSPDPEVPEQTSYISAYVDAAETALFSKSFTSPSTGWRQYFDLASAVNFYIVNDLMGNVDGGDFFSSDYLYKAKDNPLLYMGPVWDFDISAGNTTAAIVSPTVPWMQTKSVWYAQWFKDPSFQAAVTSQWNALNANGVISAWLASVSAQAAALQQSQANNFQRWPILGIEVWPNSEAAGSYNGEVSYFLNWLNTRVAYLNSILNPS